MVTVYVKPDCVQCSMTKKRMDALGVEYQTIDVMQDEKALKLIISKGFLSAPVVNAGEAWWSGFQPDKIISIL
jgi:glutaredoxin-like protein NrdH